MPIGVLRGALADAKCYESTPWRRSANTPCHQPGIASGTTPGSVQAPQASLILQSFTAAVPLKRAEGLTLAVLDLGIFWDAATSLWRSGGRHLVAVSRQNKLDHARPQLYESRLLSSGPCSISAACW